MEERFLENGRGQRPHPWDCRRGDDAGLVTNSILFCWLIKIKDRCKKMRFHQTHNQGLRQLLLTPDCVLGLLCLARHTWQCPCISVVPEATHEASRGPLRGAVSAPKALQGSETETRELLGGTEENSVSPMRGHWFALQANQWFFTKWKQKKIEVVARPASTSSSSEIVDHVVHIAETVAGKIDLLLKFPVIKTGSESFLLHNNWKIFAALEDSLKTFCIARL